MKKHRITNLILFLTVAFLLVNCRKEKTSWTSDWIVPLINDSLAINDYVNDSTLEVNGDQSIQVVLKRRLFDLDLTDLIQVPDTTIMQSFTINLNSITLSPGFTFIDEIKEHPFYFDDAVLLEARVKSGSAKVKIENPIGTKAIFTLSLPGVTKDGEVFTKSQTVDAGTISNPGIGELEFDFAGYTIDMRGKDGDMYNILQSKLNVRSDPDGPTVTITDDDHFNTTVSFENLKLDYGKGYFGNIIFEDTTSVVVEALNKVVGGAINIDDLALELSISNGIKATGQGKILLFENTNFENNTVALNHPYFGQYLNLNPAQGQWDALIPSHLDFNFDSGTGNLKEFLENLGSTYSVGYSIEINPFGNTSSGHNVIYPKSRIGVDLNANFPLKIGANDLVLQDTFAIDFANENKLLRVHSGEFILKTKNRFPYGVGVKLFLLDEAENILKEIETEGEITPAVVNENGDGHNWQEEESRYYIDEESAELLSETKFIIVKATFNSTQFTNNIVYASDIFQFLLQGQFKLKTNL